MSTPTNTLTLGATVFDCSTLCEFLHSFSLVCFNSHGSAFQQVLITRLICIYNFLLIMPFCLLHFDNLYWSCNRSYKICSDWNPHADLQAMARAHRLGQTNKVNAHFKSSHGIIWLFPLSMSLNSFLFAGNDLQINNTMNHWRKNDAVDQKENGFGTSCCWKAQSSKH